MQHKEIIIQYLNRQLETYLTAKEFADFKINRLIGQNEMFANPNFMKELSEFQSQAERCRFAIDEILSCIEWLQKLKIVNNQQSAA